jgi:intein/homing endonuclease
MCAWDVGKQIPRKNEFISNEELLKKEGFLEEKEAKLLFYEFLRNNITFATDLLMGVQLYPFQHMAIKSMLETDYSLNIWSRGLSKCLERNALVNTSNGIKKIIDVDIGEYVLSKNGMNLVEDKTVNPKQKTYKLITNKGYESEGLDYHRVLILNKNLELEWQYAKDVKIGDCVVMRKNGEFSDQIDIFDGYKFLRKRKNQIVINPRDLDINDWYYFFGILIGDGCFTDRIISITSEDEEIKEFMEYFCSKLNLNLRKGQQKNNKAISFIVSNKSLENFLILCGFDNTKKAVDKTIPYKLLKCSKDNASNLLKGLYDTDGHAINSPSRRNSKGASVGFTSCSYELIKQVRFLLLMFGIESTTSVTFKGGESKFGDKTYICNKAWSILISCYNNVNLFRSCIGFAIRRKQNKLEVLNAAKFVEGEFSNTIPYIGEYLQNKLNKKCIRRRKEGIKLNFRKKTGRKLAKQLCQYVDLKDSKKINELLDYNLFFDFVKEKEEGFSETVDIQVKDEHCYMSDGFINHNTFSCGIYAALDSIFNQGIQTGILSKSFRQCLEQDEFVLSENGLKPIKDIKVGEKLHARTSLQTVKNKWTNEISEGLEIKLKKGYSIKGKKDHKVLIYDENNIEFKYKEIKDLKIGDCIPISCNEKSEGKDLLCDLKINKSNHHCFKKITDLKDCDDFYYTLGQFIGDGSFIRSKTNCMFSLTSADDETLVKTKDYFSSILKENKFRIVSKKNSKAKSLCFSSNALGDLYEDLGYLSNKIAINKTIPHKLFLTKKQFIASFIRGLMDADGCVTKDGEVCLNTSSHQLAKEFQLLLLTFGIISKICKEEGKGKMKICGKNCIGRASYKVRITNYYNLKKYFDSIGFSLIRKQNRLKKYLSSCKRTTNEFVVPNLGNVIHNKYSSKIKHGIRKCYFNGNVNKYSIKKALDMGFLDDYDHQKLNKIACSDFYFDRVQQINEVKNIKTIDIEVENEHCYWGNGFINHNSKQIFKKIEDIAAKPEAYLLRQAITKISKSNDEWVMEIGKSRIHALPLGDGEKLRGFRFHRIIIDEFLLMPERIYNEIIVPFLSVVQNPTQRDELYNIESKLIEQGKMKKEDRFKWPNNKLIALSSASYKFEYLYKLYEQYENLIFNPKADDRTKRCIIQLSYDCAPANLYDQNLINQAKATMSESQFGREFGATFTDDSSGYFKISKMALCTVPDGESPCVEVTGNSEDEYIVSIDPSWSETEASDDFAIQVIKLNSEKQISTLVHSYALSGTPLREHIKYFLYILKNFNIVAISMDYNGGVQFLNSCNESELFKSEGIELKQIITEFEKPEEYQSNLISAKTEYNKSNYKYVFLRKPTSSWIRLANELLQANFDHRRIFFASRAIDDSFRSQTRKKINIDNLKFSNNADFDKQNEQAKMIDFVEHLSDMIMLTKTECALIQISQTAQGTQTFDLPANLKRQSGADKARKDSYSALILANWMARVYYDMQSFKKEEIDSSFTPFIL